MVMTRPIGMFAGGVLALVLAGCTAQTLAHPEVEDEPTAGATGGAASTSESSSGTRGGDDSCNGVVLAYVRDFRESHPDMERFGRDHDAYSGEVEQGIVKDLLGADRKPVFNRATPTTTTAENFWQWYNDVEGVNIGFEVPLVMEEVTPGRWRFESDAFFPADGKGFGDWSGSDDRGIPHNFHFTLELHTVFRYDGDKKREQSFSFRGDDDVFTFINNELVVDLGGVHEAEEQVVNVHERLPDLVPGETYPLDFFFAERHVTQSNFRIETSLDLQRCDIIIK